ncbi:MAG: hypothetical protein WCC94_06780 [Candidatus Bathyarchaeia archaeon]
MARSFPASAACFLLMLLALSILCPNVVIASGLIRNGSTVQSSSHSVIADSPGQYYWYYCYPWDYSRCYTYYWGPWWYYPYPYDYYTPSTETKKTFELKVDTIPAGIASVNGKGTYNQGTVASFSLASVIVPAGADQRYVFSHWSGDFSGSAPSGAVTMDSAKTIVANYRIENYLKVSVDPPGITYATGEDWYASGDSVSIGAVPSQIPGGDGIRYVFQHWIVDSVPVSGNPIEVTMDVPHTVVAHYRTQYLLTVSSEYGAAQGGGWYDAGDSAGFSVTTQVETGYGVRQVFDRWTGDVESSFSTGTIIMDSPHNVRAVWRTDSTILYATMALGIGGAFVLGIGLVAIAITRSQPKPAPLTPTRPVATNETSPEKMKPAQSRKKVKPPPKTT